MTDQPGRDGRHHQAAAVPTRPISGPADGVGYPPDAPTLRMSLPLYERHEGYEARHRMPPAPRAPQRHAPPPADRSGKASSWQGLFEPFSVGDPGSAASVPARPDRQEWDRRDTVVDGFTLHTTDDRPLLDLRAASLRGRSHRFGGKVRQDAYAFRITDDGRYLVVAVADGVSSGPLSHLAAEIATRQGCLDIAHRLAHRPPSEMDWAAVLKEAADQIAVRGRPRVEAMYPEAKAELRTFQDLAGYLATTALFAVITLEPQAGGLAVDVLPYGDTAAWVLRGGAEWQSQQPIKNEGAAIASSSTKALPVPPSTVPRPAHAVIGPTDALVLISDGVGDPLGDGTGTVGAFLAEVWARPPEQLAFAAHVDFARKSHDDDRTAVVIWPGRRQMTDEH